MNSSSSKSGMKPTFFKEAYLRQCVSSSLGRRLVLRCISTTAVRLAAPKDGDVSISNTAKSLAAPKEGDILVEHYVPKAERGDRGIFALCSDWQVGETRLARNDRRCPTRELNFEIAQWGKHKSPYRKLRHMFNFFSSSPLQRLMFPDLFITGSIAAGLTYYNEFIATSADTMISICSSGFTGATTAIGLLAGFRLHESYGRYEECRIFWGDTNNTIRDLACQTLMWMKDADQRARMLKLCKAYPLTLLFHLHGKGCHHNMKRNEPGKARFEDRVHAEFMAELRDIYSDGKDEGDFHRFSERKYSGGNTPIEVLTCMRETIAGSVGILDAMYVRELDEQCQRLCAALGASERVLRTPLPTGFTRHSSRLLFLWSNALPFALYPALGPWGTLPTALLTSYAILGIEDIGIQLEEPFDILPLRQYSDGMFDVINQIEKSYTPYVIGGGAQEK